MIQVEMDNKGSYDLSSSLEEESCDHGNGGSSGEEHEIRVVKEQFLTENKVPQKQGNVKISSSDDKYDEDDNAAVKIHSEVEGMRTLRQSSFPDIFSNSSAKGLDHIAPVGGIGTQRNLWGDNHEIITSRCKSENDRRRLDLKLDRLSQRDKEKLIANLVKIQKDGTVEVDLAKNAPVASELLELHSVESASVHYDDFVPNHKKSVPRLQIVLLVVGTRGDVQPFLAMAKRLQEFGHRVGLATHMNFREFIKSAGVEFYPLGGDPRVLAGWLIPSGPGEISIQRRQLKSIIESLLPSCTEPDIVTGSPFKAQAIVANPPAYGHVHVAEALGVPLHIFFTMPWTYVFKLGHN